MTVQGPGSHQASLRSLGNRFNLKMWLHGEGRLKKQDVDKELTPRLGPAKGRYTARAEGAEGERCLMELLASHQGGRRTESWPWDSPEPYPHHRIALHIFSLQLLECPAGAGPHRAHPGCPPEGQSPASVLLLGGRSLGLSSRGRRLVAPLPPLPSCLGLYFLF